MKIVLTCEFRSYIGLGPTENASSRRYGDVYIEFWMGMGRFHKERNAYIYHGRILGRAEIAPIAGIGSYPPS